MAKKGDLIKHILMGITDKGISDPKVVFWILTRALSSSRGRIGAVGES
jgi:hypothetical protein